MRYGDPSLRSDARAHTGAAPFYADRIDSALTVRDASESALHRHVLEAIDSPVFVFACGAQCQSILYVNPAFERWSGCTAIELLGRDWRSVAGIASAEPEIEPVQSCIEARREARTVLRNHQPNGLPSWTELQLTPLPRSGALGHYIGQLRDVTAEVNDREQLRHRAFHDALTGLPNRHLLQDRLEHAVAEARSRGLTFAVVFLDLDHFKQVNDTFGHQAGDELLQQVARRLRHGVRESDTVARLYGDEFVLLLAPVQNEETTEAISLRVTGWLRQPFAVCDRTLTVTCSVGIVLFPDGTDGSHLLASADRDMYRKKRLNHRGREVDES